MNVGKISQPHVLILIPAFQHSVALGTQASHKQPPLSQSDFQVLGSFQPDWICLVRWWRHTRVIYYPAIFIRQLVLCLHLLSKHGEDCYILRIPRNRKQNVKFWWCGAILCLVDYFSSVSCLVSSQNAWRRRRFVIYYVSGLTTPWQSQFGLGKVTKILNSGNYVILNYSCIWVTCLAINMIFFSLCRLLIQSYQNSRSN